jgi:patatin-like phospholipase/acyl hydrolase
VAEKFRILSLDGGGVRGVLTARILANIERYLNNLTGTDLPLGRRFDLLAGTSTGGLIALGLSIGKTALDVLAFYEEHIPRIFGDRQARSFIKWLRKPKYSSEPLASALKQFFNDATLKDVVTDVCITSISLQNAKPRLHKSGYLARNADRLDECLVDIGLATSAAPTYFQSHSGKLSSGLVDGGLCANNPSVVAIVEALQFEGASKRANQASDRPRSLEDLVLLSVGTGDPCAMPYDHRALRDAGLRRWIVTRGSMGATVPLIDVATESQSVLAHFQAMFLLKERYLRVNPQLKFPMRLDQSDAIGELKNLADVTREIERFLEERFVS